MPNRLANETSPYLLQHADNPVDWYPWSDDALHRAKNEGKPILVSIGYSACHWCHVMERESFENDEITKIMNREFVNIKVDREERPDLDAVFQEVVQVITGNGGWPLTVFLTPDGRPYYGGTYFPPDDRPGISGFRRVLLVTAETYNRRRGDVDRAAQQVEAALARLQALIEPVEEPTEKVLRQAYHALEGAFDTHYGGFGLPPKFPQPMVLEFLLRYWLRSGTNRALEMVEFTLQKMAAGGIRDQIGGGFHRYSTDNRWLVPHFEKMLYDNALLSLVYLHAYQATHKPFYREILEETLDYVLREMTFPSGGFYSSQDADTEGVEGKFYTWTPEEMTAALGANRAGIARKYFGVTERGRLEGRSVLHIALEPAVLARDGNIFLSEMQALLKDIRQDLFNERQQRVKPARDEKILTNWNGLMMRSFAEAGVTLGRKDYVEAAAGCARFLYDNLSDGDGVFHTWKDNQAKVAGFLEDYAMLIEGSLSLHEATLERRWLDWAQSLAKVMADRFWDSTGNQFVDVRLDQPVFLMRPRNVYDGATPSGASAATFACLRLASITKEARYEAVAMSALRSQAFVMRERPLGSSYWLCALDFHLGPVRQIVIVGPPSNPRTEELVGVVLEGYRPNHVLVGSDPSEVSLPGTVPLLQGKSMTDGLPTAFVCEGFRCGKPVNSAAALRSLLQD